MTKKMTDQEAAEFYAEPANQRLGGRVVSRGALASSIPVRFPPDVVDAVNSIADARSARSVCHRSRRAR